MKSSKLYLRLVTLLSVTSLAGVGCAPVFSDMQSAKLVGRNHHEFTPSATRASFSSNDPYSSGMGQTELSLQFAAGVNDRVDMRARYVYVQGVHVLALGPKFGLVKDRVALSIPLGVALNAGDSLQVHPTLIGTLPAGKNVELNGSLKYLIPLSGGGDKLVAVNLGLGLGPESFKLRPEVGMLFNPGKEGHYAQFSLGMSFYPGR